MSKSPLDWKEVVTVFPNEASEFICDRCGEPFGHHHQRQCKISGRSGKTLADYEDFDGFESKELVLKLIKMRFKGEI